MGRQISLIAYGEDRTVIGSFLFENKYMVIDEYGKSISCPELRNRTWVFISKELSDLQFSKWGTIDQFDSRVIEMDFGVVGKELLTGTNAYRPGRIYLQTPYDKAADFLLKDYQRIVRFIKSKCVCVHKLQRNWNVYIFPEAAKYIRDNGLIITPNC